MDLAFSADKILIDVLRREDEQQLSQDSCLIGNNYNGKYFVARITAVPVLFILSGLGSFAPLIAMRTDKFKIPSWVFSAIKFFGSGVIIATGFIHLMAESSRNLTHPCLGAPFVDYPFAEGIALIALYFIFFFDVISHRRLNKSALEAYNKKVLEMESSFSSVNTDEIETKDETNEQQTDKEKQIKRQKLSIQKFQSVYQKILQCIILECGIVLHSLFVGLSLAIAGDEFISLYIAIGFHQFFEGLGLGTRFATTEWPEGKKYVPWLMSLAYSFTTPFACGMGLIVRDSYPVGSRTALIVTGVFDASCAGILIYNSVAELMAFDFIYSGDFDDLSMKSLSLSILSLTLGAFAMAIIGKWA
ncbi:uncharacterized protein LODBEIA_P35820 [Lodderomyces beijingensis]|uniref:Zinc-regulated transporter 1 n=1 Tax=Lodderomyces beijingensis TaxID=1775926 RepID=A0ABP0ZMH1_9ASCO